MGFRNLQEKLENVLTYLPRNMSPELRLCFVRQKMYSVPFIDSASSTRFVTIFFLSRISNIKQNGFKSILTEKSYFYAPEFSRDFSSILEKKTIELFITGNGSILHNWIAQMDYSYTDMLSFGNFFGEEKFSLLPSKNKVADEKKF